MGLEDWKHLIPRAAHLYILIYSVPIYIWNLFKKIMNHIYTLLNNGNSHYNGIFGVNPAVDEFCEKMGYKVNHTGEWFATWWFVK